MKQFTVLFLTTSLLLPPATAQQAAPTATPVKPAAEQPAASTALSGGSVFLGTRALDNADWPGRVSEYEANKGGARPAVGINYWYSRDSWFFDFFGENRGDSRAQSYYLNADLNRRLRIRSSYERFLHRLDNDPLTNLDVAKGTVVVRHDDLAPNRAFVPGRNELNTEISGYINSWLSWRASHKFLQIHGEMQTRSISKCANCHITARSTRIDQRAQDISGGLSARLGRKASLHYDFTSRQFREHGETPYNQYDVAQHPSTLSRMFLNRVIFDGTTDGKMPYARVPGFRKETHDVKLNVDMPAEAQLAAQLLKTTARNTDTNLNLDVLAWSGRYTLPLGERANLKLQFRKVDMDSDDVFIELQEPIAPEGPQTGKTYPEAYPAFGQLDYTRGSTINRRDVVASAEASLRLARLTTLKGGYEFRSVRRDNLEVERTDRNRLNLLFSSRKANDWKTRIRYTFDAIDQPFLHHKAALSPALQLTPSAGNPPSPLAGLQYFALYAARQADLTNQPTRSQFFEPSFSWTPSPKAALNFHYRSRSEKNDNLNFSVWKHDSHAPGVELWVSPLERLNFTASYQMQYDKTDTLFVIPVFDG
jgi:hypothetical protein